MKIVFFGTPYYVLPILQTLHKKLKVKGNSPIAAVVTQKPKPAGRKKELKYSAVDEWAHKRKVPKYYDANDLLKNDVEADIGILASYGKIVPKKVIKLFPHGILNVHPSDLPLWRGASPVQATMISESQVGGSIIKLNEKLDSGPIISQFKESVLSEDTTETLRERLFKISVDVLVNLIPAHISGKIEPRKQDETKATYTRQIKKADAFIPPKYVAASLQELPLQGKWKIEFMKDYATHPSPSTIHNFIRAMQPWPQAWTTIKIKNQDLRFKILKSHLEPSTHHQTLTEPRASQSRRQSTNQKLVFDLVQLESKNPVPWKQFKEGHNFEFE
ncbi:methionyl-tRNA formyltransferase [Patescibacteria group bacterium]